MAVSLLQLILTGVSSRYLRFFSWHCAEDTTPLFYTLFSHAPDLTTNPKLEHEPRRMINVGPVHLSTK
eukprot:3745816-Prymnesium_polylepis.1